ncbi:MAG: ShlB/FhaC/HecB family hemolysin secretion/activation protein [Gammaproteobacteria bacterium]
MMLRRAARLPAHRLLLSMFLAVALTAPAHAEDTPVVKFRVDRFLVEGDNPIGAQAAEGVLAQYAGDYEGVDGLLAAADALEQALAEKGFVYHRVVLPPQKLNEGAVTLQIRELKIGKVSVTGNTYSSEDQVRGTVRALRPGQTPNALEVDRALEFANRHPTRVTRLKMKESETPDAIDAELAVEEQRPWRFFGVLNNIGTEDTGRLRMTAGAQHTNLWHRDHQAVVTYTMAPDSFDDVLQVGFQYQMPLYWDSSTLSVFYVHSDVQIINLGAAAAGVAGGGIDLAGAGDFVGVTFAHRMLNIGRYSHGWSISLQDKLFNNEFPLNAPNNDHRVRSRPVVVQYDGSFRTERTRSTFYLGFSKNVTNGAFNNDRRYVESPRSGATADWESFRFGGTFNYRLPLDYTARVLFDAQYADQALIAGEQFGAGGVESVRGFAEREIAGDSGYRGAVELWSPPLPYVPGLRALAFMDLGHKWSRNIGPGEVTQDTISSIGAGLRWNWKDHVGFNLDYGHSLADVTPVGQPTRGSVKWHFTLFAKF